MDLDRIAFSNRATTAQCDSMMRGVTQAGETAVRASESFRVGLATHVRRFMAIPAMRSAGRALAAEQWPAVASAYWRVLQIDPSWTEIWVQYGNALKEAGELAQAAHAYRHATKVDRSCVEAWSMLAGLLASMGAHDEFLLAVEEMSTQLPPASIAPEDHAQYVAALTLRGELLLERSFAQARDSRSVDFRKAEAAFEIAATIAPGDARLQRLLYRARRGARAEVAGEEPTLVDSIRYLAFGTTSLCNASCIHCPTGKPETDHVPRKEMPLALLSKVLAGLTELNIIVTEQISFGLFGDGLVDKQVVERARIVRQYYPEVPLVINTNGAAFDEKKHSELRELDVTIGLHVESLIPDTYDRLMAPLRLSNVRSKIESILACFFGHVHVSIPVSRLNAPQLNAMREYFLSRGAHTVSFDPLSNRCRSDKGTFEALAFAPLRVRCAPDILDDLVVDCDGTVLFCCQDFQRQEPAGNLALQTVEEALLSISRHEMRRRLAAGDHHLSVTCSNCYADGGASTVAHAAITHSASKA